MKKTICRYGMLLLAADPQKIGVPTRSIPDILEQAWLTAKIIIVHARKMC